MSRDHSAKGAERRFGGQQHWTGEAQGVVLRMFEAGATDAEIADALGRTPVAIRDRRQRLRLYRMPQRGNQGPRRPPKEIHKGGVKGDPIFGEVAEPCPLSLDKREAAIIGALIRTDRDAEIALYTIAKKRGLIRCDA